MNNEEDKYEKYKKKNNDKHSFLVFFILIICLFIVYDFEILIHCEAQFEVIFATNQQQCSSLNAFDANKMFVIIQGLKRSKQRRAHAKEKCHYFEENGINCTIFEAFDGEKLKESNKNSSDLMNKLIKKKYLPASSNKLEKMNEKGVGGMACSITKTMIYRKVSALNHSRFDYVLIVEDDAVFPIDFIRNLQESMAQISTHRVAQKWDLINLYPLNWCDRQNIHRLHLQRMSGTLYRYHQRQPFAVGFLSGYASEVAILFKLSSIKQKIIKHLPVDCFSDLWLAKLIRNRQLNAFTFCPSFIQHGRFQSDIQQLN